MLMTAFAPPHRPGNRSYIVRGGVVAFLVGTMACGSPIPAAVAPDAPTTPLTSKDRKPTRESVALPGRDLVRGRSRVVVDAPIDVVRKHVLDFNRYAEFMPHYRQSKTYGRTKQGGRLVLMEVAALGGLVKMWAKIDMPPPITKGDVETHESRFVDGNVDDFKAIWRLRTIDANRTALTLEVFLEPSLPLPDSIINSENVGGAVDGAVAMRARIEGRRPAESTDP